MATVVDFIDNGGKVKEEFLEKVQVALAIIGENAEGYAKEGCPVATGRLRNSITYATTMIHSEGNTNKHKDGPTDASPEDYATHATPEENALYIGTNVEYAPYVEFKEYRHETGGAHFLRNAATDHNDEYKKLAMQVLKSDASASQVKSRVKK